MSTKKSALKKLAVKLGCAASVEEVKGDTISEVIQFMDENAPFGQSVTVTDTLYVENNTGEIYQESQYSGYVLVTTDAPSYNDIVKGVWGVKNNGNEVDYTQEYRINNIEDGKATNLDSEVLIVHEDCIFWNHDWKKGVWFHLSGSNLTPNINSLRFAGYQFVKTEVKTLDPKFVGGGVGGGMIVKMTENTSDVNNIYKVIDKTFNEIAGVIESGGTVMLAFVMTSGLTHYYKLAGYMPSDAIWFDAMAIGNNLNNEQMGFYTSYVIGSDNSVQESNISFTVEVQR